ncbi:DegT/DnrJ/EryC1/StrS family aminotransferase [Zhongshania aliphaticivorans]|uniref:DegT/DnrJ/EryC1/StrS family aminotransferase n=1 Tax=Zhongshania aliphaticivorans TaxID=1470434 RepID=UPI0012E5D176|nr:DegT/DnrJ/EryC1/StrS family aminotransferase [Zhongshania aliphaticivorans]CAA0096352.1 dTDP-4-amino-4,6-dideoxy-D-glucose transaminase [Zhongshania aliphaticivorans]
MINVTKTYLPNKKKYKSYVDKIYESGWVTNDGFLVRELTERLEDYLNVRNLVLVSNGTSALEVAYRVLELEGDVITTPFSFVATTSSLVSNGLNPIFADIDISSFNLCPENVSRTNTGKESAILATHVFGVACDIDALQRQASKRRLKVIYDAAHCFGVKYRGKSILSYGDVSVISFHATKLFHTIEGGAIILNHDNLVEETKFKINFGIDGVDSVKSLGINAKMNEFEAAMGLCVLDDIELILEERQEIADFYFTELNDYVSFQGKSPLSNSNNSYFPVLFENKKICETVLCGLNREDIFPRRYFAPSLDTLPYISGGQFMSVSRDISSRVMALPIYPGLAKEDQIRIVNQVKKCLVKNEKN